jgi:hypothetical protein
MEDLPTQAARWLAGDPAATSAVEQATRQAVETRLLRHGDDGLLEYFAEMTGSGASGDLAIVGDLSRRLLRRRLFKQVARCSPRDVTPGDLYEKYGEKARRRDLEERAAQWAGIEDPWKLVIWLPPSAMRLKPADVLVSDGSSVRKFVDYEKPTGQRGNEIYRAHENLWSIGVYVADELKDDPRVEIALVMLAAEMDVRWEQLARRYSAKTSEWPIELLRRQLDEEFADNTAVVRDVLEQPLTRRRGKRPETFTSQLAAYRAAVAASLRSSPSS